MWHDLNEEIFFEITEDNRYFIQLELKNSSLQLFADKIWKAESSAIHNICYVYVY